MNSRTKSLTDRLRSLDPSVYSVLVFTATPNRLRCMGTRMGPLEIQALLEFAKKAVFDKIKSGIVLTGAPKTLKGVH